MGLTTRKNTFAAVLQNGFSHS